MNENKEKNKETNQKKKKNKNKEEETIEESEYQEDGCNTRIQKGRRMHELHI